MKKSIIFVLAILLSVGAVTPVLAQDSVSTESETRKSGLQNKVQENQAKLEESREKLRLTQEKVTETRDEAKTKAVEFRKDIAKTRGAVAERVFNATIERLEKLIERMESRVVKLKADGVDVAETESFIALAKGNILDAKAHIANMGTTDVADREQFELVKSEVKEARLDLIEAKKNLMNGVQAMKGLGGLKRATTSTEEVETE